MPRTQDELKSALVNLTRDLQAAEAAKRRDAAAHNDTIKDLKADIAELMDELEVDPETI